MSMGGLVAQKGAPVTFTMSAPSHDAATGRAGTPTITVVSGNAMEIASDPELLIALGLIDTFSPTLLFTPKTAGRMPDIGASVVWGGEPFTVKNIQRLAMAGTATAAKIVVTR